MFLVRDRYLQRELALKLLREPSRNGAGLEEVQREFAFLAAIEHPGIARAFDFGYLEGRPFFTSEFIAGEPLAARGTIENAGDLLRTALDLARALAFLHAGDVLHLDVKPANILRPADPRRGSAVLIDFGLCRRGSAALAGAEPRGSLPYMAPECFRDGSLGPWTDIYALGVTLYELATGVFPRPGPGGPAQRGDEAAWDPAPRAPSTLCPRVPRDLDGIILKCLALDPRSRFPSAVELLAVIGRIGGGTKERPGPDPAAPATLGRASELAQAERFLDAVLAAKGALPALLVTGQRGSGQTHFLRELKTRAQAKGFRAYLETGFPGRTGWPGALLRALGSHVADPAARRRWSEFLAGLRRPRRPSHSEPTEGELRLRRAGEVARAAALVREPLLLLCDGLEGRDEVSIALLIDLVRSLGEKSAPERPPIAVAAGYREEGPCVLLLRELTEYLLRRGKGTVITLGPLGLEDTLRLHALKGGKPAEGSRGLVLLQETGGLPARIAALAAGAFTASAGEAAAGARRDAPAGAARTARALDPGARGRIAGDRLGRIAGDRLGRIAGDRLGRIAVDKRRLLLALVLLGRPASLAELGAIAGRGRGEARREVEALEQAGLAARARVEDPAEPGPPQTGEEWVVESAGKALVSKAAARERRRVHGDIARMLLRVASRRDPPPFVEALGHLVAAGRSREVVAHGLRAGRYLRSHLQNRAALAAYRAVLAAIPAGGRALRLEVAIEVAALHAQIGSLDEGLRILRESLSLARGLSRAARARGLLRLATLHSRRGDFRRADRLFREGFALAGSSRSRVSAPARRGASFPREPTLGREDRLYFLNEHAALKAVAGDQAEALRLCDQGLRLAGRGRTRLIREATLNLHATRAGVALRRCDLEAATDDLETALEIAESMGSPSNQATVLNNLGVVYLQSDRYAEALRSFREAEALCLRLDEGPSLASIHGNLAVLHARLGDGAAMERALEEGERLVPGIIGRRQEFFLKHARGLCLVQSGRHAAARPHLEAALRLGREMGDVHVPAFDDVYRAECLVFEGAYAEAGEELRRLSAPGFPARPRRMALARRAYLGALLGARSEVEEAAREWERHADDSTVPFLDAWDGLFLGWAFSLAGAPERAATHLRAAAAFFAERSLGPALRLARLVEVECWMLRGETTAARDFIRRETGAFPPRLPPGAGGLEGVFLLLLAARVVLGLPGGPDERAQAADLLAEAGAALAGNALPEWSARLEALRAALRDEPPAAAVRGREDLARALPAATRRAYLASPHWKAWTATVLRGIASPPARARAAGKSAETRGGTRTAVTPARPSGPVRACLAARSPGMRRLTALLDRLRDTDLPVLIAGETGSGKELVARVLHGESRRAAGRFLVLDCATLPAPLIEAELFGARAGAFTDLTEDRPGLLRMAAGGTLFIDDAAGLPLEAQAKLLRVLSGGAIRPLGGEEEVKVDVRFVVSTARDLEAEVSAGRLRADLHHRLRIATLVVPPLRERPEDFPELVAALLAEGGGSRLKIGAAAMDALKAMPWPGNVRELRNFLARLRLEGAREVTAGDVERAAEAHRTATVLPRNLLAQESLPALKKRLERDYLAHHFRRVGGEATALARFLAVTRRQLYRRCERLGFNLREERRRIRAERGDVKES